MEVIRIEIITYPNQKVILIEDYSDQQEGESYTIVSERERIIASRLLNDKSASLILWLYLAGNKGGFQLALSPKAINNLYSLSQRQYDRAISRLKEEGYLVPNGNSGKEWLFKRIPDQYKNIPLEKCRYPDVGYPDVGYPNVGTSTTQAVNDTHSNVGIPPREGGDYTYPNVGRNSTPNISDIITSIDTTRYDSNNTRYNIDNASNNDYSTKEEANVSYEGLNTDDGLPLEDKEGIDCSSSNENNSSAESTNTSDEMQDSFSTLDDSKERLEASTTNKENEGTTENTTERDSVDCFYSLDGSNESLEGRTANRENASGTENTEEHTHSLSLLVGSNNYIARTATATSTTGDGIADNELTLKAPAADALSEEDQKIADLEEELYRRFGFFDGLFFDIAGIKQRYYGRRQKKYVIGGLQRLIEKYQQRVDMNRDRTKREYELAVNATRPEYSKDMRRWFNLKAIQKRYEKDHEQDYAFQSLKKNGYWIKGWNEERQEPDIVLPFVPLPPQMIAQQRDNIDDIPEWYVKGEPAPTVVYWEDVAENYSFDESDCPF